MLYIIYPSNGPMGLNACSDWSKIYSTLLRLLCAQMGYPCRWVLIGLRKARRFFRIKKVASLTNNRFLERLQFRKRRVVRGEFSLAALHRSHKEERISFFFGSCWCRANAWNCYSPFATTRKASLKTKHHREHQVKWGSNLAKFS